MVAHYIVMASLEVNRLWHELQELKAKLNLTKAQLKLTTTIICSNNYKYPAPTYLYPSTTYTRTLHSPTRSTYYNPISYSQTVKLIEINFTLLISSLRKRLAYPDPDGDEDDAQVLFEKFQQCCDTTESIDFLGLDPSEHLEVKNIFVRNIYSIC